MCLLGNCISYFYFQPQAVSESFECFSVGQKVATTNETTMYYTPKTCCRGLKFKVFTNIDNLGLVIKCVTRWPTLHIYTLPFLSDQACHLELLPYHVSCQLCVRCIECVPLYTFYRAKWAAHYGKTTVQSETIPSNFIFTCDFFKFSPSNIDVCVSVLFIITAIIRSVYKSYSNDFCKVLFVIFIIEGCAIPTMSNNNSNRDLGDCPETVLTS